MFLFCFVLIFGFFLLCKFLRYDSQIDNLFLWFYIFCHFLSLSGHRKFSTKKSKWIRGPHSLYKHSWLMLAGLLYKSRNIEAEQIKFYMLCKIWSWKDVIHSVTWLLSLSRTTTPPGGRDPQHGPPGDHHGWRGWHHMWPGLVPIRRHSGLSSAGLHRRGV